jgi:hypothetical protein
MEIRRRIIRPPAGIIGLPARPSTDQRITIFVALEDLNIVIGSNNGGAWAIEWNTAQQTDIREVNVNAGTWMSSD